MPDPSAENRPRQLLPKLLLLLLGAVLYWVAGMHTLEYAFSYGDEGFVAEAARRIYRGEVPYRDFFNMVTPGSYYFYAGLFKLFGPTFFALRCGVLLTAALILVASWWLLHRAGVRAFLPYALCAAYFPFFGGTVWFIASYHWLVLMLCLFSLCLLLGTEGRPAGNRALAAAGALAALAALTMQHKGGAWLLAATVALLVSVPGERKRALRWFWGGALAVSLPVFAALLAVAGWDTLVTSLVEYPLFRYNKIEGHRGSFFENLQGLWLAAHSSWSYRDGFVDWVRIIARHTGFLGMVAVFFAPFLGGAALCGLWRRGSLARPALALLTAFFVASYLGALHRWSTTTLVFAAPSALFAALLYLHDRGARVGSALCSPARTAQYALLGLFAVITLGYGTLAVAQQCSTVSTPAGEVSVCYAGELESLEGVTGFFREHGRPGEKIFCYPYLPMFYFLLQKDNPTPYDIITYPINTQEQLDHARQLLEADRTRWFLWNHAAPSDNSLERYLADRYQLVKKFRYVSIFERRRDVP